MPAPAWIRGRSPHRRPPGERRAPCPCLDRGCRTAGGRSRGRPPPLADAGVPLQALGWMLRGDNAPLRFRPAISRHQWRWCLRFLQACRRSTNRRNAAHLLRLALHSQRVLRDWREGDGLSDFAWRANGKLVIYRSRASLDKAALGLSDDGSQQLLDAEQFERAAEENRGQVAVAEGVDEAAVVAENRGGDSNRGRRGSPRRSLPSHR